MVILRAEQEIHEQDGDGSAGDDHDAVAEKEEAEHVVDFTEPHVVHDEIELDHDGAEGEDADKEHGGEGAEVGYGRGDLAGDLVGADGGLDGL